MEPDPLRAALAGLVDYAGLFPPAALELSSVVRRFGDYTRGRERWMLGRLIVPISELDALSTRLSAEGDRGEDEWTISVLLPAAAAADGIGERLQRFNDAHERPHGAAIVSIECAVDGIAHVERLGRELPEYLERYIEVGIGPDAAGVLDAVSAAGCYGKFRTGGIAADRFPSSAALAAVVCDAAAREVPFKATAGLHHPIRGAYAMTYERDSPSAWMHGFINLVTACAVLARDRRASPAVIAELLDESDPRAFSASEGRWMWRDQAFTDDDMVRCRAQVLRSVGSCSFEEPVNELRALGWGPRQSE